jgi:lactate dehydrogenase-like 2-hydroxyacid dehydrogenase
LKIQIIGDNGGHLEPRLRRWLEADISGGLATGRDSYAAVLCDTGLLAEILSDDRLAVLVLVEPGIEVRDRAVRTLAALSRPALEIVELVAARIHATRTWTLIQTVALGVHGYARSLESAPAVDANLVQSAPAGESWLSGAPAIDLDGRRLGLIGFGPMAWKLAGHAAGAGMEIEYWPQSPEQRVMAMHDSGTLRNNARESTFAGILGNADVIAFDLEFGADSIRLIDAPELALMRQGALLVNTSHGRIIDEGALIQALRLGNLSAVGLDRFNYEPLPHDSPLREFENVLLTPGIAIPDEEAVIDETARLIAVALHRYLPEQTLRRVRRQTRRLPD